MVLQWAPTECYLEVCKDVICNVKKLGEEAGKLKDLLVEVGVCEAFKYCVQVSDATSNVISIRKILLTLVCQRLFSLSLDQSLPFHLFMERRRKKSLILHSSVEDLQKKAQSTLFFLLSERINWNVSLCSCTAIVA